MAPQSKPEPFKLTREEKAQKIVHTKGAIKRLDKNHYVVKSQSGNGEYHVISTEAGWRCACPDNTYRHAKCKHVWAIEFSMELRKEVEAVTKVVIPPVALACRFCSSDRIIKFAVRHNKYGDVQRYKSSSHYSVSMLLM